VKILIVGEWVWPHYEKAFALGLRACNVDVNSFSTSRYFLGYFGLFQKLIPFPGKALISLNNAVLKIAKEQNPDIVLFWRPTHILPKTLKALDKFKIASVSYNNDDPFGPRVHGNVPWHHHLLWFWYIRCLSHFKYNLFYRKINCTEAMAFGAKHAAVLLPYFMPWQDRPVSLSAIEKQRYSTEVVFVGHYEPDGREDSIRALVRSGIKFKLWGGRYWNHKVLGDIYDCLSPISLVEGAEYTKAICGADVCLCFLSKMNRDTYTRRCFEIPACGKVMLAERTDDLLSFFKEDEEACFFSTNDELVQKAKWLIRNPEIRNRIAQAGLRRVWLDGHDVDNRAKYFLSLIQRNRD
jgi:spore maturation protein CgeB